MRRHRLIVVLASLLVALVMPAAAHAYGTTIAEAPTITYGSLEGGGGHQGCEYWRLSAYTGDRVAFRWQDIQGEYAPHLNLFSPETEDATIRTATPLATEGTQGGANLLEFTVPFTGLGVIQVMANTSCYEYDQIATYTFTATVTHAVSLSLNAPTLARRGSVVTVTGTVRSVAGTPEGSCLFEGVPVPVTGGHCSKRVRLGRGKRQTVHVSFVPAGGWQDASARRTIRLVR